MECSEGTELLKEVVFPLLGYYGTRFYGGPATSTLFTYTGFQNNLKLAELDRALPSSSEAGGYTFVSVFSVAKLLYTNRMDQEGTEYFHVRHGPGVPISAERAEEYIAASGDIGRTLRLGSLTAEAVRARCLGDGA